jgi:hypothetical protein
VLSEPSSIEKWYRSHCNGDWEHQWGVQIETVDNPGWRIIIDLRETKAAGQTLEWAKIERSDEDWLMYRVASDKFEAACGPLNLSEALEVFTTWYDSLS